MSEESDQRAAVIAEAMTWLGTPFRNNAAVKGQGVDCAQLLAKVFANAGVVPPQNVEIYSPQFFLHHSEEKFLSYVLPLAREIAIGDAREADVVVYKIGRVFAHGAIVLEWPKAILHAHLLSGRVLITGAFEGDLFGRDVRAFSFWGR